MRNLIYWNFTTTLHENIAVKNVYFVFNRFKNLKWVIFGAFACFAMADVVMAQQTPLSTTATALESRDATEYFFNKSFNNLNEELQTARDEGKSGIMIMFTEPDCPWCHKMEATILNQKPIQDYYRSHFRILNIDTKGDTLMTNFDEQELAEKDFSLKIHRVRATPVFMFFDTNGKEVMRYTGAAPNVDEFMMLGEYVVNGEYKNSKFTRYKQQRLADKKTSANF